MDKIQASNNGLEINGQNLAAMAFADDIVLLAKNKESAMSQTLMVDSYLQAIGMSLSVDKSSVFEYVPKSKSWFVRSPRILIRGSQMPYGEPAAAFKYLGAKVSPWNGLLEDFEVNVFEDIVARTAALPIKPMQKIDLLRTYLLLRFTYGLIARPPSSQTLRQIDIAICSGVKRILHLHESTTSAFFYTPRKENGLGLLQIEKMVLVATFRSGVKATQSGNEIVRSVVGNEQLCGKYSRYAAALGLEWPVSLKQLDDCKQNLKKSYATK